MCGIGVVIPFASTAQDDPNVVEEVEKLRRCVRRRGPDCLREMIIPNTKVICISSILHMRGDGITKQPYMGSNGDFLMWNGEVFGGIHIPERRNDTSVIFNALCETDDVMSVLSKIEGPWACVYYRKKESKLYFGRDKLGRRSLLFKFLANHTGMCLSSVLEDDSRDVIDIGTYEEVTISDTAKHVIYENLLSPGYYSIKELPPYGVYTLQLTNSLSLGFVSYEWVQYPCIMNQSSPVLQDTVEELNQLLRDSVWRRISSMDRQDNQSICVMYSGGIDCTILVALVCELLQTHHIILPIELVNVAFGDAIDTVTLARTNQLETRIPDRLSALKSLRDLLGLYSEQTFRFVEMNIATDDLLENEQDIYKCVYPCTSQMDFQIGCCYWFLSRGEGKAWTINPSNHTMAVECIDRLVSEMRKEEADVCSVDEQEKCKTKNCMNRRDGQCCMGMCAHCCLRVQKKTNEYNKRTQKKKREEIHCLCHVPPQSPRVKEVVLEVYHEETYALKDYLLQSKVVLSGIGADEMCGGYVRYKTVFQQDGYEACWKEMLGDWGRLWIRNLGRDDRCIARHGREMRSPYLDEAVSHYLHTLPIQTILDFSLPRGEGDKMILRHLARRLGLSHAPSLCKRAIQFGSRIVKEYNTYMGKGIRESNGDDEYVLMTSKRTK